MYLEAVEGFFESAHLLSFHQGKCANLHGHSYKVTCSWKAYVGPNGRYLQEYDFSNLKKLVKEVCEKLDHAVIFSDPSLMSEREHELYKWAEIYSMKYCVLPTYSTSEGIGQYFLKELKCDMVSVQETSTSQSVVTGDSTPSSAVISVPRMVENEECVVE